MNKLRKENLFVLKIRRNRKEKDKLCSNKLSNYNKRKLIKQCRKKFNNRKFRKKFWKLMIELFLSRKKERWKKEKKKKSLLNIIYKKHKKKLNS